MQKFRFQIIKKHLTAHFIFYSLVALLITLIYKDPFSGKNLISSFQPFPDALFYVNAAQNLASGNGLKITYKQFTLYPTIPPLYSIALAPIYLISTDPRAFYLVNVALLLISFIFFYNIIIKIFKSKLITFTLLFIYVTDVALFMFPSLPMSENLLICLFITSIYLLLTPLSTKKSIFLGLITIAFFATKYVAWTLSVSLIISYMVLIFYQKIKPERKLRLFLTYFLTSSLAFIVVLYVESLFRDEFLYTRLHYYFGHFEILWSFIFPSQISSEKPVTTAFATSNFRSNFDGYLAALMGGQSSVAGADLPLIPIFVGMSSLIGIFVNLIISKLKILNLYILITFTTTLAFLMLFFTTDTRYIIALIPLQILSFGILYDSVLQYLEKRKLALSKAIIVIACSAGIIFNIYPRVVEQWFANFSGQDSSLPYQTIEFINEYFDNNPQVNRPKVITLMPPLLIQYYSNNKYDLLPFSRFQHFMSWPEIWGLNNNKLQLSDLYKQYLREGQEIYLSSYFIESALFLDTYNFYKENFTLIEVSQGCQNRCKLYRLEAKY